jgi:hypothetical protein
MFTDSSYRPQLLASASDPDGAHTVRSVRVEIYPPYFSKPAFIDSLLDDGRHGDGAANDGIFGQTLTPAKFGCNAGLYSFVFRAVDLAASQSPAETKVVMVSQRGGQNSPPLLTELQAPATISRNATPNTYLLSVRATDPNAPCDGIAAFFQYVSAQRQSLQRQSLFDARRRPTRRRRCQRWPLFAYDSNHPAKCHRQLSLRISGRG